MKLHRHLFVVELNLAPSAEWTDQSPAWRFVRISRGVAYWLSRGVNKELASGEVVVVAPNAKGAVRASQLGEAQIHYYEFSPELLGGFFSLFERHHFDAVIVRSRPPVQFLLATHPAAECFSAIISPPLAGNTLLQRCEGLRLAVTFFLEELTSHKPPPSNSPYALYRFRQIIQQVPDQEVLQYTPEQLAQLCGCSPRHFGRLFRKHFGVSLRARQTELRLLMARQLLLDSDAKVIEVAMESGYRSLGLFNTMFKKAFGMTPSDWRRKHAKKPGAQRLHRTAALLLAALALALGVNAAEDKTNNAAAPGQTPATTPTNPPPTAAASATNTAAVPATNKPPTFEVRGYEIRGNSLLPYEVLEPIFTNYIGAAVTFDTIRKGLADLQMAYRERGFVTASVKLPVQQLTNGLVKVEVIQGKLTEINVTGNRYFSSNNVGRLFPSLQTNTVLNGLVFQQELDRANNNLDRQIYPVIGPGPDPGTTSLLLKVKDRLPLHGRVELDNYSTPNTPELRLNAALQYNNLWQLDHQFGVQYSFSPTEVKEGSYPFYDRPLIANYSAFYRMPLSGANGPPRRTPYDLSQVGYDEATKRFRPPPASDVSELLFYASRSSSDTGLQLQGETLTPSVIPPAGALQVSDRLFNQTLTVNDNLGGRFLRPLPEFEHIHSSISFGPDYKNFHSSTEQSRVFQATIFVPETGSVGPPFTTFKSPATVTSRGVVNHVQYLPLSLNWDGSITDKSGSTFFNINNTFNWSGVFDNADDFRAAVGSKKADGTYYVGQFGLTRDQKLLPPDWTSPAAVSSCWSVHLHADGQWTTQPLISNEQFANGGNAGARGYRDGQIYSDTGWRIQLEPRTPQWNLGLVDAKLPLYLRAFAFMDYGEGYLIQPGSRSAHVALWGTGFGLIGSIGEHLDFRCTIGIPLLDTPREGVRGTFEILPAVQAGQTRVTFSIGGQF